MSKQGAMPVTTSVRTGHWWITIVILLLLVGTFVGFWEFHRQTSPEMLEVEVILDGKKVDSSFAYSDQQEVDILLDAVHLLDVLENRDWLFYTLPDLGFRFQNQAGDTIGMDRDSTQAQFYDVAKNQRSVEDVGARYQIFDKHILVPVKFAAQWLSLEIEYEPSAKTLKIVHQETAAEKSQEKQKAAVSPVEISSEPAQASSSIQASVLPEKIDCSYQVNGQTIAVYAVKEDKGYFFADAQGTHFLEIAYEKIGSASQPNLLLYSPAGQEAKGVIVGLSDQTGNVLYGVLSFKGEPRWVLPCYYDDIWMRADGRFVGRVHGGTDTLLS